MSQDTSGYIVSEGLTLNPLYSQNVTRERSVEIDFNRNPVDLRGYGIYSGPFQYAHFMFKKVDSS